MQLLQRIAGVLLMFLGIVSAILTADGTATILLVSFGLFCITSREQIISIPERYIHRQRKIKKHPSSSPQRKGA